MAPLRFWLSHHFDGELHRTYAVGKLRICARCLGTYPTVLLAFSVQVMVHAPLELPADAFVTIGLFLPALADWAYGRFFPEAGSNAFRTLTGILLGTALARSLYVHVQRPFPVWLWAQMALVLAVAVPVFRMSYRRARQG
jgi:uncharacterized membrane protein